MASTANARKRIQQDSSTRFLFVRLSGDDQQVCYSRDLHFHHQWGSLRILNLINESLG
jgi:hypothetical protein